MYRRTERRLQNRRWSRCSGGTGEKPVEVKQYIAATAINLYGYEQAAVRTGSDRVEARAVRRHQTHVSGSDRQLDFSNRDGKPPRLPPVCVGPATADLSDPRLRSILGCVPRYGALNDREHRRDTHVPLRGSRRFAPRSTGNSVVSWRASTSLHPGSRCCSNSPIAHYTTDPSGPSSRVSGPRPRRFPTGSTAIEDGRRR